LNVQTLARLLPEDAVGAAKLGRRRRGLLFWLGRHPGFILFVLLPTLLGTVYFEIVAAPIYMSTAQFIVTNVAPNTSLGGMAGFLANTGLAPSSSYAYSVAAYMASRDALATLEKKIGIREIYDRPDADFLAKFPNIFYRSSFENLYAHFSDWVQIYFDPVQNITTITVYAFRPGDCYTLTQQLLSLSEYAVNRLNARAGADVLKAARAEVDRLQQRLASIQTQINEFRNRERLLDPNQVSQAATALGASLESDLVSARALLAEMEHLAPASPVVASLRSRIATLEEQAANERRKNAGGSDTLAPKMSEYDALLLQQQFVQQLVQAAISTLNSTQVAVSQQRLYVERVAEPSKPDIPWYPYRTEIDSLLVLITAGLIYGIGRILVAAIREHVLDR
jgi:capsular polysaccharide transport system permease protein